MRDEPSDSAEPTPPMSEREVERVLLLQILEPPACAFHLRDLELALRLERREVERALGRLLDDGLAVREGDFASPTRAATRFAELCVL